MRRWVESVGKEIAERALFREQEAILVAVSGGVDSMVLLHVLHELAPGPGWRLVAAHFNHQLRGADAEADERLVEETAARLGLAFRARRGDVRARAKDGGVSLMAARMLRHDFLAQTALAEGCQSIALAHHQDDQIELFFLRLLRGAGHEGIAGMKWRNPSPSDRSISLARPFLGRTRAEIVAYAAAARVPFREDASNASTDIPRNRIRRDLIPRLVAWHPNLRQSAARLMEIASAESDLARGLAEAWRAGERNSPFEELPLAVQRRCLEQELLRLGLSVNFDLVETLRLQPGVKVSTGPGRSVLRLSGGGLQVDDPEPSGFDPGSITLSLAACSGQSVFEGVEVSWRREPGGASPVPNGLEPGLQIFDADTVGESVELRHWRPGDRFQPSGTPGARKLQNLFVNLKIPRADRRGLLVGASADGVIFWVEGLRVSERFKLAPATRARLEWRWQRHKTSIAGRPGAW